MESSVTAPGRLETVRKFINTKDVESGADEFLDPEGLARWLANAGLTEAPARASGDDLRMGVDVREALRALAAANHGSPLEPGALEVLNRVAEASGLRLSFSRDGAAVETSSAGVPGALGRLLSVVADAMNDGTWSRLKLCMNDDCAWAFYDHARNRSGKWCDMSVCGNRMKARAYRKRRTGATQ